MKTIIIIPTYNEIDNVRPLLQEIFLYAPDTDVLIVDDNATNREILGHQLQAVGMAYDEVDSAVRALETLRNASMHEKSYDVTLQTRSTRRIRGCM